MDSESFQDFIGKTLASREIGIGEEYKGWTLEGSIMSEGSIDRVVLNRFFEKIITIDFEPQKDHSGKLLSRLLEKGFWYSPTDDVYISKRNPLIVKSITVHTSHEDGWNDIAHLCVVLENQYVISSPVRLLKNYRCLSDNMGSDENKMYMWFNDTCRVFTRADGTKGLLYPEGFQPKTVEEYDIAQSVLFEFVKKNGSIDRDGFKGISRRLKGLIRSKRERPASQEDWDSFFKGCIMRSVLSNRGNDDA